MILNTKFLDLLFACYRHVKNKTCRRHTSTLQLIIRILDCMNSHLKRLCNNVYINNPRTSSRVFSTTRSSNDYKCIKPRHYWLQRLVDCGLLVTVQVLWLVEFTKRQIGSFCFRSEVRKKSKQLIKGLNRQFCANNIFNFIIKSGIQKIIVCTSQSTFYVK